MVGFFPAHDDTYVFFYIPKGKFATLKSRGLDSFRECLAGVEPALGDSLDSLNSWDDVIYVATKRIDVKDWVADRVALMGDAVHAINPSFGQGLNLTLQDAVSLANTLKSSFESGDFSIGLLKQYEISRRRQVEFIQRQAERAALLNDTESRFYSWLGKRILRKIGREKELMAITVKIASGLLDEIGSLEALRFLL